MEQHSQYAERHGHECNALSTSSHAAGGTRSRLMAWAEGLRGVKGLCEAWAHCVKAMRALRAGHEHAAALAELHGHACSVLLTPCHAAHGVLSGTMASETA